MINEKQRARLGVLPGEVVVIVFGDGSIKSQVWPNGEIAFYGAPPPPPEIPSSKGFFSKPERVSCVRNYEIQPAYSIDFEGHRGARVFRCSARRKDYKGAEHKLHEELGKLIEQQKKR